MHINTHNMESLAQRCRSSTVWYFRIYLFGVSPSGWHALFCITENRHGVTITAHAIKCHFLNWMTTVRQLTGRRCSCFLILKYTFVCVYWWTRQIIQNILIVVDRYLRPMGDKTIPDWAPIVVDRYLRLMRRSLLWNRLSPIRRRCRSTTSRCMDSYNLVHLFND